jgi:hypothetical protein
MSKPSSSSPWAQPTTETITVTGPGDLAAITPYLLGFTPSPGDVVLVAFGNRKVLACAIIPPAETMNAARVWDTFLLRISSSSQSVDDVHVLCYASPRSDAFTQDLLDLASPCLGDAIRIHDGRWRSLLCTRPACCPPGGTPIPQDRPDLIPLLAPTPLPGRDHLGDVLNPGPADLITTVAAHLDTLTRNQDDGQDRGSGSQRPAWEDGFRLLDAAHVAFGDGPLSLTPEQAAALLHALNDVDVRDRCLAWDDDAAWWLWTALIHHAPPGWAAPAATLIAATAYQHGNGALARVAAQHAQADQPHYSMAGLLLQMLAGGVHPSEFTRVITDALVYLNDTSPSPVPGRPEQP